jgi:hypothetical protein
MTKKLVIKLKFLSLGIGIFISVLACENDFKNVGVNIVDNDIFSTEKYISDLITYSKNIEFNKSNGTKSQNMLGVQRDAVFGKLEASFVTQLQLQSNNPDFGTNAVIDSVIVDIPYNSHRDGTQTNGDGDVVPKHVLDSVWVNGDKTFLLNVFELETYLQTIDPEDPTKAKEYFSNDTFLKTNPSEPLYSALFSPNENDTMTVVNRYKYPDYPDLTTRELYKTDTIKAATPAPSMKIPFDKATIKNIFQDNLSSSEFASNANFQYYFRGLYFEAIENNTTDGALMLLNLTEAKMTIYYSNDVEKDEKDDEDLDGNGITGEDAVQVRTANTFVFPFNSVKANIYSRDITGSDYENYLSTMDIVLGEEQMFVSGAAGPHGVIKLFGDDTNSNGIPDELEELRTQNWLINDAKLIVYIDKDYTTNWTPERLYLYNIGEEEDTQITDAMPQAILGIGGKLERDEDGVPEKYVFHITDYIKEVIKSDSEVQLHDLGLKVYDSYDTPNQQTTTDTIVKNYNSNPKGLVLKGNLPNSDEYRAKLQIYYTSKN